MKNGYTLPHISLSVSIFLLCITTHLSAQLPAFPGAEGAGAYSVGGRGGEIIYVTSLADAGPGTLRDAIERPDPRIVVFAVGGIIELNSALNIQTPYITIAGQTAPGDGICLKNYSLNVSATHDVIVRYIRSRHGDLIPGNIGDGAQTQSDFSTAPAENIIFDHCSFSWSIDELISVISYSRNVTIQWCFVTEALNDSRHPTGTHAYGSVLQSYFNGGEISVHHSLYAHNKGRNPKFANNDENQAALMKIDFRNNVVYNHGQRAGLAGSDSANFRTNANIVANYYKNGPSTLESALNEIVWVESLGNLDFYVEDNKLEDFPQADQDNWLAVRFVEGSSVNEGNMRVTSPISILSGNSITTDAAEVAYERVLNQAGANVPYRDPVDTRIARDVRDGTGSIIDSQTEVGGWPAYANGTAPTDTDQDGMPDQWENANGLNPNNPSDAYDDQDGDGYHNIEEYFNELTEDFAIAAFAGLDRDFCETFETNLEGNNPGNGTGRWFFVSGTADLSDPFDPQATISNLSYGTTVLEWRITTAGFPTTQDTVSISNYQSPTTANAGADRRGCQVSSVQLGGNTPLVGTGVWRIVSGTGTLADSTSPTTLLSGMLPGQILVEWEISNGVCPVSRDTVFIEVFENPTIADAGDDQALCNETSSTLNAVDPAIGTGFWRILSGSGTLSDSTDRRSDINGLQQGFVSLEWRVESGPCVVSRDTMMITINATPQVVYAGPDQEKCNIFNATLDADPPPPTGTGVWSVFASTAVVNDPSNPKSTVSNLQAGVNGFIWKISEGVCPGQAHDTLYITVYEPPSQANAGDDLTLCDASSAALNADNPAIGVGLWTVLTGPAQLADPADRRSEVNNLQTGTNEFVWTVSETLCGSTSDTVAITVLDSLQAFAGADQDLCDIFSTTLSATPPPANASGVWTVLAGGANLQNPNNPVTNVNNLALGSNRFRWQISNDICPPDDDDITVFTSLPPSAADAGPDQSLAGQSSTTMEGNNPSTGIGYWRLISGQAIISDSTLRNATISGLVDGLHTFEWRVENGACPAERDSMQIEVEGVGGGVFVSAGPDQRICIPATIATMAADVPPSGTGTWRVLSGTATILSLNDPHTQVTGLLPGITELEWRININGQTTSRDTCAISVEGIPQVDYILVINDLTVSFTAIPDDATTYSWKAKDGWTSTLANPVHTFPGYGTYKFRLQVRTECGRGSKSGELTLAPSSANPENVGEALASNLEKPVDSGAGKTGPDGAKKILGESSDKISSEDNTSGENGSAGEARRGREVAGDSAPGEQRTGRLSNEGSESLTGRLQTDALKDLLSGETVSHASATGYQENSEVPMEFALLQNYPNPFNPATRFGFQISESGFVSLRIYDIQGRLIRTVVSQLMEPGTYTARWDGRNDSGLSVSSGIYLYRLAAGSFHQVRKMLLTR